MEEEVLTILRKRREWEVSVICEVKGMTELTKEM